MLPGVCPIRCMQGWRLKVFFVYSSVNTNTYQFQGLIEFPFQIPEQRRNATDFDIKDVERLVLETWVRWMRQETFSWKTFLVSAKTASSKSLSCCNCVHLVSFSRKKNPETYRTAFSDFEFTACGLDRETVKSRGLKKVEQNCLAQCGDNFIDNRAWQLYRRTIIWIPLGNYLSRSVLRYFRR